MFCVFLKKVSVVLPFEARTRFVHAHSIALRQLRDAGSEVGFKLAFRDTANRSIFALHGNVVQIVQVAEYAQLAELGDTREQGELDGGVAAFEIEVEGAQRGAVVLLQRFVARAFQERLVVFVHQDDDLLPGTLASTLNDAPEAAFYGFFCFVGTVKLLPFLQAQVQVLLEVVRGLILLAAQIQMQHGVLHPFGGVLRDGKSLEQILLATEVCGNGGQQQRLPEAPWAAEEVVASIINELLDERCLVHVDETTVTDFSEILKTDGVLDGLLHGTSSVFCVDDSAFC